MGVGQHGTLPQTGQQAIPRLLIERGINLDLKSDCFSLPLLIYVRFHRGRIVLTALDINVNLRMRKDKSRLL